MNPDELLVLNNLARGVDMLTTYRNTVGAAKDMATSGELASLSTCLLLDVASTLRSIDTSLQTIATAQKKIAGP